MLITSARRRATAALDWLGLSGVVLLAALLCDLFAIVAIAAPYAVLTLAQSHDTALQVPGLFAMAIQVLKLFAITACALWARNRPIPATWTGAAVLALMAASIWFVGATMFLYAILLSSISFTELVAGIALVYFCVRSAHVGRAVIAITGLVIATFSRVFLMGRGWVYGDATEALLVGFGLLLSVILGLQARNSAQQQDTDRISSRLRQHSPLVGLLTMALFLEVFYPWILMPFYTWTSGIDVLLITVLSLSAAVVTLVAPRRPFLAGGVLAAIIALSGLLFSGQDFILQYAAVGGITLTQAVSSVAIVIFGIRYLTSRSATKSVGLLSLVIFGTILLNHGHTGTAALRSLFAAGSLLLGIAIATGLYLRTKDSERKRIVDSAVHDTQTAERMALARELHDVVAHHVTGIVVQAQATKMAADQDFPVAHTLDQIEQAGTDALTAMRRLVSSMRQDSRTEGFERETLSEQATTDLAADLRALVNTGNHPVPIEIELNLPAELPHEVARSALRLVQEALTNVGKHAVDATLATVLAETVDDTLHLRIVDNATQHPDRPADKGGYGLIGMRERVELLHGTLSAGPGAESGWVVDVWLPLREEDMR